MQQLQKQIDHLKKYIENLKKHIAELLPYMSIDEYGNICNNSQDENVIPHPLCMNKRRDYFEWIQEEAEAREQIKREREQDSMDE